MGVSGQVGPVFAIGQQDERAACQGSAYRLAVRQAHDRVGRHDPYRLDLALAHRVEHIHRFQARIAGQIRRIPKFGDSLPVVVIAKIPMCGKLVRQAADSRCWMRVGRHRKLTRVINFFCSFFGQRSLRGDCHANVWKNPADVFPRQAFGLRDCAADGPFAQRHQEVAGLRRRAGAEVPAGACAGQADRAFGGVPRRGVYGNMKTAADKVRKGEGADRQHPLQRHDGTLPPRPGTLQRGGGPGEGRGGKNVRDSRKRLRQDARQARFDSLDALNARPEERCRAPWQALAHPGNPSLTIAEALAIEQERLMPLERKPGALRDGAPFRELPQHRGPWPTPAAMAACTARRPAMADTVKKLKEPKLCGRAQCRAGMAGAGTANLQICEGVVRPLLEAEHTDRGVRSIRYQPRPARFPVHRGLAGFRLRGLRRGPGADRPARRPGLRRLGAEHHFRRGARHREKPSGHGAGREGHHPA